MTKFFNMHPLDVTIFLCIFLVITSCSDSSSDLDLPNMEDKTSLGVIKVEVTNPDLTMEDVYEGIFDTLSDVSRTVMAGIVDNQMSAETIDVELNKNTIVLFSNLSRGAHLIADSPFAVLDLPNRILIFEDSKGKIQVAFNDPQFYYDRHDLYDANIDGELVMPAIEQTLHEVVGKVTGEETPERDHDINLTNGEGVVVYNSPRNFDDTYEKLEQALYDSPDGWTLMDQYDHQRNADAVGVITTANKSILMSAPHFEIPLIQVNPTAAMDVPQHISVVEDGEGKVYVIYNDVEYIKKRHHLQSIGHLVDEMSASVRRIVENSVKE